MHFRSAATLLLVASAMVQAADWPQFRGPSRDGISPETGLNKDWAAKAPKELWRIPLTDSGYGGPVVAGGVVYFIDHAGNDDVIRAVKLADGQELWRHEYPDATRNNYGFTRSSPTVEKGRVYTVSRLGKVHCLDAGTGKVQWQLDLVKDFGGKRPGWDYAPSPVIDGDKLLLVPGGATSVVAVDKTSGKTLWKGGSSDAAGYSTPVIATLGGKKQYVVFTGKMLSGLDPETGKPLWSFPWTTPYDVNASAPLIVDGGIFISTGYGTGCALVDVTATGAKERWRNKSIREHFSSAVTDGKYIYSTDDAGAVVCLDAKTGVEKWRGGPKSIEKGGLIAADGALIVLAGKSGELLLVEMAPEAYKELGKVTPLGGQSWVTPVLADGKLLVRNNSALACLDMK